MSEIQLVANVYSLHIQELMIINRTLIYSIFALTFAFYFAFIKERKFQAWIISHWKLIVAFSCVGNGLWAFLSHRATHHLCLATKEFLSLVKSANQHLPQSALAESRLDHCLGIEGFYQLGSAGMILGNWLLFALILGVLSFKIGKTAENG